METVIIILMTVVCFNYILKQTYCERHLVLGLALAACIFVGCMWPYAIEQNKNQIHAWLNDSALMKDLAVLLSVDILLHFAFCIMAVRMSTAEQPKKRSVVIFNILRWFPGILFYPVLFSLLVLILFTFPGHAFPAVSWTFGAVVAVTILLAVWGAGKLVPEDELRLELLFIGNVLILCMGIICTVNGQTAVAGNNEVNWPALGGILLITLTGAFMGLVLRPMIVRHRQKFEK